MSRAIIDRAFKLATEAQDLESKCEYGCAASRYMESVRLFLGAIPKMNDEKSSKLIRGRVKIILDRAEECKRLDIPKAPKEDEEEEEGNVDESTFEARLKKLKKRESLDEPTEASIMERFDRYRGVDPKKAQAQREAEAIQRRRWLAGLGGPPKKLTEEEQRAKLLGRIHDEVRLSKEENKDIVEDGDVDVDPMIDLDSDSMHLDLSDDENNSMNSKPKYHDDEQNKLSTDARDLISQARTEISRDKEKKKGEEKELENEELDLSTFHDSHEEDSRGSKKKTHDTLLALFEKKIITKEQYETAKRAEALHLNALKLTGQDKSETTNHTASVSKSTSGEVSALDLLLPEAPKDEPKIQDAKKTSDLSEVEGEQRDFKDLVSFLRRCGLEHLYGRLHEWGVKCVLDIDDLDPDELADMGVSRIERRRLMQALRHYEW